MFDNALNRDTVYYEGLTDEGWQTTTIVYARVNEDGYALTLMETERLLFSLMGQGKVEKDTVTLGNGEQCDIWKRKKNPHG